MTQQETFTRLYRQYAPGIRQLCRGYTGSATQAEDLLQESFLAVWNNMHKYRGDASWGTWIYRIAVNTCLLYLRKEKTKPEKITDDALLNLAEEEYNQDGEVQLLYKCISRLPETDRLIISMVLEELPYEDIASIAGITANNLRVKIHRIKKQLTEMFNSYARV
ncbi:sigma-70 family RNA polymerase sigma factor [Pontibacter sp. HSC-14F20]|uniref:RNA polymerase sigma factor n=1 Tax=Pontibacter sp. HSC-14F20 TaxID=2864136 RepID=UPI001C73AB36|nr:sigma-70 family RNA polymerase sigma factor [Pontibacter sp. HSC-14F20]MBX0334460.1 sigma-70 family RNA polymerase sigma factor [Pontibacter sp. HSC-14F20]